MGSPKLCQLHLSVVGQRRSHPHIDRVRMQLRFPNVCWAMYTAGDGSPAVFALATPSGTGILGVDDSAVASLAPE